MYISTIEKNTASHIICNKANTCCNSKSSLLKNNHKMWFIISGFCQIKVSQKKIKNKIKLLTAKIKISIQNPFTKMFYFL